MIERTSHKLRAAVYVRVSTAEQVEGNGAEAQLKTILNYIEVRHNLEFAWEQYIYQDLAVSWADPIDTRGDFMRMVNDIRHSTIKPFDVVIVYKLDRFARKLSVLLEVVEELEELWIGFISTQEALDTNNAFGKAMLWILWVFSELERDMIQERTKMWIVEWLDKWSRYRLRRYGYLKDNEKWTVTIIEDEAEIVKKIFEMFVYEQSSISDICKYLTNEKVLNPSTSMNHYWWKKNKYWPYERVDKTVRQLLREELYIGKYYYNKQITEYIDKKRNVKKIINVPREQRKLSPIEHEPIISKNLFQKAQDRLNTAVWTKFKSKEDYMLSGLIKCDCCKWDKDVERVSRVWNNSNSVKSYRCRWRDKWRYWYVCPTTSMSMEALDTVVINDIKRLINNPQWLIKALKKRESLLAHKETIQRSMEEYERKIFSINKKMENLKELREDWEINREEFQTRLEKLRKEMDRYTEFQKKLHLAFDEYFDIEAQQKVFELLEKLAFNVDDIFKSKEKTKELLNLLIEEIVVFSEHNDKMIFPGKKKEGERHIPHTIMIKFKLPQDFMNGLYGEDEDPIDNPDSSSSDRWSIKLWEPVLKKDVPEKKKRWRPFKIASKVLSDVFDVSLLNELINQNITLRLNDVPTFYKLI